MTIRSRTLYSGNLPVPLDPDPPVQLFNEQVWVKFLMILPEGPANRRLIILEREADSVDLVTLGSWPLDNGLPFRMPTDDMFDLSRVLVFATGAGVTVNWWGTR